MSSSRYAFIMNARQISVAPSRGRGLARIVYCYSKGDRFLSKRAPDLARVTTLFSICVGQDQHRYEFEDPRKK